jgi:hypothetical protein
MMRTRADAHWSLLCRSLARALLGAPSRIERVDGVLAEDGRSVVGYCYFGDGDGDVFITSWDLAADRRVRLRSAADGARADAQR